MFIKFLCSIIAKIWGWKYVSPFPKDVKSCVVIGAPHTSNFDFIPAMFVMFAAKVNGKFAIKKDWLFFPLNMIFGYMGAIGIDRKKIAVGGSASTTDLMANLFKEYHDLCLFIAPEGTRSPNENWKTGFYYIAQKAGVPIVMAYADYETRTVGYSKPMLLSNLENDMKIITNFYRGMEGKNRSNFLLDKNYR